MKNYCIILVKKLFAGLAGRLLGRLSALAHVVGYLVAEVLELQQNTRLEKESDLSNSNSASPL